MPEINRREENPWDLHFMFNVDEAGSKKKDSQKLKRKSLEKVESKCQYKRNILKGNQKS